MQESEVTEVPVVERRRVVVEVDVQVPRAPLGPIQIPQQTPSIAEIVRAVRRELQLEGPGFERAVQAVLARSSLRTAGL